MALAVAMAVVLATLVAAFVLVGRERGPAPADVAIAYETAWDRLDFDLLYSLSGEELRDGLRRDQYVAAKQAAYAGVDTRGRVAARVDVEHAVTGKETALVVTRVATDDGAVRNGVVLERRAPGWVVVAYSLRPDGAAAS